MAAERKAWRGYAACAGGAMVLLSGCGGSGPITSDEAAGLPAAHHGNGVSLTVEAVERRGDRTFVSLRAVNGTDRPVQLAGSRDPMLLVDAEGRQIPSTDEQVEVQPYSVGVLRAEFAEGVGKGPVTLLVNSRFSNDHRQPKLIVRAIPVTGRGTTFTGALPAGASIASLGGHHPTGTVVTLEQLGFVRDGVEISFSAVNGSSREVELARRGAFLQDPEGNRYPLVPPDGNRELAIPPGEKLVGVLRFAGRVAPAAGALSLHLNERGGTNEHTSAPRITIAGIPVTRSGS